jgi:hypothetical protein
METTTTQRPAWVRDVQPNRWFGEFDHYWRRERFVVLAEFANGWHVGFTNDPQARSDYYWRSGVSEQSARECFAMASVGRPEREPQ